MSNEQAMIEDHSSPIKTPKQLLITVVLAFVVPIAIIIMLVNLVVSGPKMGAGSNTLSTEAINKRIAPVAGFALVDAHAPKVLKTGEQVFATVCAACHTAGVAGAPKFGDNAAWAPYIMAGYETMLHVALQGKGAMPAKGGNPGLSDYEVARAVVYMANHSGAALAEPVAPTDPTPSAAAAPPATAPLVAATATTATPPAASAPPPAAAAQTLASLNPVGEKLYKTVCFACHASGVANAPKFGDKTAWEPYLKTGIDAMVAVVLQGKGAMPPKGGAFNASTEDIRAAVQYMVHAAQ
jgi:cytochrome c5